MKHALLIIFHLLPLISAAQTSYPRWSIEGNVGIGPASMKLEDRERNVEVGENILAYDDDNFGQRLSYHGSIALKRHKNKDFLYGGRLGFLSQSWYLEDKAIFSFYEGRYAQFFQVQRNSGYVAGLVEYRLPLAEGFYFYGQMNAGVVFSLNGNTENVISLEDEDFFSTDSFALITTNFQTLSIMAQPRVGLQIMAGDYVGFRFEAGYFFNARDAVEGRYEMLTPFVPELVDYSAGFRSSGSAFLFEVGLEVDISKRDKHLDEIPTGWPHEREGYGL